MAQVLTGPQGILSVTDPEGVKHAIGRARNISVNSDFQRDYVYGIGNVAPEEIPLIRWQGQVSIQTYAVLTKKAILHAFDFSVQDKDKFFNYLLFQNGIDLLVTSKRLVDGTVKEFPVFSITGMFITSEGWDMAENAIWGKNGAFAILNPPRVLASELPGAPISED